MQGCPRGYYGDPTRECRCTPAIIQRYLGKISGPLLDRIDIQIEVPAVPYKELRSGEIAVSSGEMRDRAERAAEIQRARGYSNARMPARAIRILKVARTVADLDGSDSIVAKHIAEAIQYRSLDRNYWN